MIEPFINIETKDFELTADGDLVFNTDDTNFQDFAGNVRVNLGADIFQPPYGIPWHDIAQFGRIEATDNLISSYLQEKAIEDNVELTNIEVISRIPTYLFSVGYRSEEGRELSQVINPLAT